MTSEMLKQFDLAQGTLRKNLLTEDICDLLDSYSLTGLRIRSCTIHKSVLYTVKQLFPYQTIPYAP